MFKKSLASVVSCAVLFAGPGNHVLTASAQTMARVSVTGVSVTPIIGNGLNSPVLGASSLNRANSLSGSLTAPNMLIVPGIDVQAPIVAVPQVPSAMPVLPAALTAGTPLVGSAPNAAPTATASTDKTVAAIKTLSAGAAAIYKAETAGDANQTSTEIQALFGEAQRTNIQAADRSVTPTNFDSSGNIAMVQTSAQSRPQPALAESSRKVTQADLVGRSFPVALAHWYGPQSDYIAKMKLNADHTVQFYGRPEHGLPDGIGSGGGYFLFKGTGKWSFKNGKLTVRANGRLIWSRPDPALNFQLTLIMDFSEMTRGQLKKGEEIPASARFSGMIVPQVKVGARPRRGA